MAVSFAFILLRAVTRLLMAVRTCMPVDSSIYSRCILSWSMAILACLAWLFILFPENIGMEMETPTLAGYCHQNCLDEPATWLPPPKSPKLISGMSFP